MRLYSYWRSSASYRVRIALNLKGFKYDIRPVNLLEGEQHSEWYRALNPQGLVPTLTDTDWNPDAVIGQSLAIIEYLDEAYPWKKLLPDGHVVGWSNRARVRQMAQIIACDIHPLQNLRVLKELKDWTAHGADASDAWCSIWITAGFRAYETLAERCGENFSFGNTPTLADCCLIPQVYSAMRFGCDLSPYPQIKRIYDNCMQLEAFQKAAPENQPDAPK